MPKKNDKAVNADKENMADTNTKQAPPRDNYHDKGYKGVLSKKRNFLIFLRQFVDKEWVKLIDERSLQLCDKGFVDPFFD